MSRLAIRAGAAAGRCTEQCSGQAESCSSLVDHGAKLDCQNQDRLDSAHDGPWRILPPNAKKEYPAAAAILKKGDGEQGLLAATPGR